MSAPNRLTIRDSLVPVARYNTSLPREIKRQLRLKPGVSYEQFLAAVKADGFEALHLSKRHQSAYPNRFGFYSHHVQVFHIMAYLQMLQKIHRKVFITLITSLSSFTTNVALFFCAMSGCKLTAHTLG
jgi:hypothetical protein